MDKQLQKHLKLLNDYAELQSRLAEQWKDGFMDLGRCRYNGITMDIESFKGNGMYDIQRLPSPQLRRTQASFEGILENVRRLAEVYRELSETALLIKNLCAYAKLSSRGV